MKSYSHLYEVYLSDDTYYRAVAEVTKYRGKNKNKRKKLIELKANPDKYKAKIIEYAKNPISAKHTIKVVNDGFRAKKRNIIVPTIFEQIVHHMLIITLQPILTKGMYEHSYGSIPGRGSHAGRKSKKHGTHGGKETIEKWIRRDKRGMKYCLKMDIRHFYESVPRDILKAKFKRIIHDDDFFRVLCAVIDVDGAQDGLPIGFYTSQWFANWYLTDLDHFIKEQLGAPHYVRYVDDMVVFDGNKRHLHRILDGIERYLRERLGLTLKGNYQIFLFHFIKRSGKSVGRFLDFMGFRFYRNRTTLRRSLLLRITRKARAIARRGHLTIYTAVQMISYLGWIDATDTYGAYLERVKPFVNIQSAKRRIAAHQRAVAHKGVI